ncbi:MAG: phosphate ABC transporter, permease protein PstA, partial [Pseudohongiella sp.]|nr:phosphate ABC transporter, permease protein PstA [Pseudohongiella sp.]
MGYTRQWFKSGTPWIWLNGGAVAFSMIMVAGLIGLIAVRGFGHFWPSDVALINLTNASGERSTLIGQLVRSQTVPAAVARDSGETVPDDIELVTRHLIKLGNRDQTGRDFAWYLELGMEPWQYPRDIMVVERREWGNFYGQPLALLREGAVVATPDAANFMTELQAAVTRSIELHEEIRRLERGAVGRINARLERLRLDGRRLELDEPPADVKAAELGRIAAARATLDDEYAVLRQELDVIYASTRRDTLQMRMADGNEVNISLAAIMRITEPNAMSVFGKSAQYVERLWEFLTDDPREANTEGGIFPAIFGT